MNYNERLELLEEKIRKQEIINYIQAGAIIMLGIASIIESIKNLI